MVVGLRSSRSNAFQLGFGYLENDALYDVCAQHIGGSDSCIVRSVTSSAIKNYLTQERDGEGQRGRERNVSTCSRQTAHAHVQTYII